MEEAVALTMNFCPNKIKEIRRQILESEIFETGGSTLFSVVAVDHGMDFQDLKTFESRLFLLDRACLDSIVTHELSILALKFDWTIPAELNELTTSKSGTEVNAAVEALPDNERVNLLKQIGALALLLADKSSVYAKGKGDPNASQIAQYAVEQIEDLPGLSGAGKSSIRKSIKEGIELLKM
jgi:hypothetical protein